MPMILFVCSNDKCKNSKEKFYKKTNTIPAEISCEKCHIGVLERALGIPNTTSTQIIDNGAQARQVEVKNIVVEQEREKLYRKNQ